MKKDTAAPKMGNSYTKSKVRKDEDVISEGSHCTYIMSFLAFLGMIDGPIHLKGGFEAFLGMFG